MVLVAAIPSTSVQWAAYREPASVEHMRVDLRGTHIAVPQQRLHRADVVTVLHFMWGSWKPSVFKHGRFPSTQC